MPPVPADFEENCRADLFRAVFPSTMASIDLACEKVTGFLKVHGPDITPALFSVNLVLREGLTNAVRHGNRNDPQKKVILEVRLAASGTIAIKIEDEGDGFDWKAAAQAILPEEQDHGRGIIIMKKYFSKYAYNTKGNILFLEKYMSR